MFMVEEDSQNGSVDTSSMLNDINGESRREQPCTTGQANILESAIHHEYNGKLSGGCLSQCK